MTSIIRRLFVVLAAFALLASACGDDETADADSDDTAADAPAEDAADDEADTGDDEADTGSDDAEAPAEEEVDFPTQPITMIVPFAAGGGVDTQARIVAAEMEATLGQPINVINSPGGGGTVGVQEMLAAGSDGHTIAYTVSVAVVGNPILQELAYGLDDVSVVAIMSTFQSAVVTSGDAPYDDWDGFIAYSKENPGMKTMFFGAESRAALETIAAAEGLEWEYVPGQGGSDLPPALLSGDVDFGFSGGIHARFLESGEMKVLLNMNSTGPLLSTPDMPTATDLYDVAVDAQAVVVAPAGVSDGVIGVLEDAVEAAGESDAYGEILANIQYPLTYLGSEAATEMLQAQVDRLNG